jgi:hypothetical protein
MRIARMVSFFRLPIADFLSLDDAHADHEYATNERMVAWPIRLFVPHSWSAIAP